MTPERWQRIKMIFYAALEQSPKERASFIDSACVGDEAARHEISRLISAHEKTDNFLSQPAYETAARWLVGSHGLRVGEKVAHYQISGPLGAGGMGEIYLARDTRLGRNVALKLLPATFVEDIERLRRFEQEARVASALNHPNICTIYEIGLAENGRHLIAMEYVEGETLRARLSRKHLKQHEVLDIAAQIAAGLADAHAHGIIHRDIKPENVMVRPDGLVKVLDFGLAKLTEQPISHDYETLDHVPLRTGAGLIQGTVAYMSPEQARGFEVDHRTDIWSLGVVLYEMASGRTPFQGETPSHVIVSILESEPFSLSSVPTVPVQLERIVRTALCKNVEERYQTVRDLAFDLKGLKEELEGDARLRRYQPNEGWRASDPASKNLTGIGRGTLRTVNGSPVRLTRGVKNLVDQIGRHQTFAIIALLTFLVVAISLIRLPVKQNESNSVAPGKKSIAVLPLTPINAADRDDIYEIGVTDSLISRLSSSKQLVVRPLSAIRRYAGLAEDPLSAGKQQQVDYILASNYQLAGGRIRITAQLFDVANGQVEETYQSEKDASNVFAMEDAVADEVGKLLMARLTTTTGSSLPKRGTNNEDAYRSFLQGMVLFDRRNGPGAEKAFEQAVLLDANYAQAWAGIAHALRTTANNVGTADVEDEYRKSTEAINRALALDPNLSEAYSARCDWKMYYEFDYEGAEAACRRAIELKPDSALAHNVYARFLNRGRLDEAIPEIRTAIDLDPTSSYHQLVYMVTLTFARRWDEAVQQLERIAQASPNIAIKYFWLVRGLDMQGTEAQAFERLMRFHNLAKTDEKTVERFKNAYQTSGWKGVLREQARQYEKSPWVPTAQAGVYAGAGELDKAFATLEEAYRRHDNMIVYLRVDPRFDSLRSDPRFDELARRIRLR